jgi:hypothetical protein
MMSPTHAQYYGVRFAGLQAKSAIDNQPPQQKKNGHKVRAVPCLLGIGIWSARFSYS